MNNRRGFFKSLGLIAAGSAGFPGIFIPKFEPVKWKVARPKHGWMRAEFRYYILQQPAQYDQVILHFYEDDTPVEVGFHTYPELVNNSTGPYLGEWKFETCDSKILTQCV